MITFTGGDNFYGYRLGIEFLVAVTPAFAFTIQYAGRVARALLPAVVALQGCAFAIGAVFNNAFLPEEQAWHDNGFIFAMRELWPFGPIMVAIVLVYVLLLHIAGSRGRHLEVTTAARAAEERPTGAGVS